MLGYERYLLILSIKGKEKNLCGLGGREGGRRSEVKREDESEMPTVCTTSHGLPNLH